MKVSKIFGCVLSLHLCVIVVLLLQPGCQTGQPPTQIHTQDRAIKTNVTGASRTTGELIPATRMEGGQGLDAAFNAGIDNEPLDFEPVEPIDSLSGGQTVDVSGPGYQSYTVKRGDNLWSIAKRYGVSLDELYAVNDLNKNSVLRVGQQIQIPVEGGTATVSPVTPDAYQPSGYNQETTNYTVKRGDTLSKIANQFDTTVGALKASNGKTSDMIRVGEVLTVPAGGSAPSASTNKPTTSVSASSTTTASQVSGTKTHTVKAGEYPAKIARQYGMTTKELLAINGISDPRKLRVGQKLTVSGSGSSANVDSRVETVVSSQPEPAAPIAPLRPSGEPTEIRVIEADPLVEGELDETESDAVFDNAVEIPIIRVEE